jgi:hypothetical protein
MVSVWSLAQCLAPSRCTGDGNFSSKDLVERDSLGRQKSIHKVMGWSEVGWDGDKTFHARGSHLFLHHQLPP